ncbi:MAG: hypothetical protein DRO92_04705 [Candidatus Altiarchaeales archaeon]|nr:MAG: hypothetical protein DRO92_04705 [Candidatus Altiarchaeales archaeon]
MTITADYIRQCKEAIEIQREWKPQVGDYVWLPEEVRKWAHPHVFVHIKNGVFLFLGNWKIDNGVWLPQQDQLQKMVEWNWTAFYYFTGDIAYKEPSPYPTFPAVIFKTPEQLCLAFVMYKKYNKVWNEGKWVEYLHGGAHVPRGNEI